MKIRIVNWLFFATIFSGNCLGCAENGDVTKSMVAQSIKDGDAGKLRSYLQVEPSFALDVSLVRSVVGKPELLKLLLEVGASQAGMKNISGIFSQPGARDLLDDACSHGGFESAKLLLDHGTDPNVGVLNLPLMTATWNCDAQLVDLLLSRGADPNISRPLDGSTPLHMIATTGITNGVKVVNPQVNVAHVDRLFEELRDTESRVALSLLKAGADVQIKDKKCAETG